MGYKIIYHCSDFGIYDVKSMEVIQTIYAHNYSKQTGNTFKKSFLIKNGRSPNKQEEEYNDRLTNKEKAPHNAYWFNWCCYSVQNILINSGIIPPSSKVVKEISEKTFGHKLNEHYVHIINRQVRNNIYNLKEGLYGINVWQIMIIKDSLLKNNIEVTPKSISLLFNKIYKREPKIKEIKCCQNLFLNQTPEEIENEIKSIVEIKSEKVVSSRSRRTRQQSQRRT